MDASECLSRASPSSLWYWLFLSISRTAWLVWSPQRQPHMVSSSKLTAFMIASSVRGGACLLMVVHDLQPRGFNMLWCRFGYSDKKMSCALWLISPLGAAFKTAVAPVTVCLMHEKFALDGGRICGYSYRIRESPAQQTQMTISTVRPGLYNSQSIASSDVFCFCGSAPCPEYGGTIKLWIQNNLKNRHRAIDPNSYASHMVAIANIHWTLIIVQWSLHEQF